MFVGFGTCVGFILKHPTSGEGMEEYMDAGITGTEPGIGTNWSGPPSLGSWGGGPWGTLGSKGSEPCRNDTRASREFGGGSKPD